MEPSELLHKVMTEPRLIESLYTCARVVDPLSKKVDSYLTPAMAHSGGAEHSCFDIWGNGGPCTNCVSVRALNQGKAVVKIQYDPTSVLMVTAIPVEHEGDRVVVELIRDITNDGIINVGDKDIRGIHRAIDRNNEMVVRDAFTRLYNEQFVYERLPFDLVRSKENSTSLALFLVTPREVDAIVTAHGHAALEDVLREIAKTIGRFPRGGADWAARRGDVGFVLVMSAIGEKQAYRIRKRIADKIGRTKFHAGTHSFNVEVAVGMHLFREESLTVDQLLEKAAERVGGPDASKEAGSEGRPSEEFLRGLVLTAREKEVAELLFQGQSNSDIARELFVGIPTVKKHVSSILDKAGVRSRAAFVAQYKNAVASYDATTPQS